MKSLRERLYNQSPRIVTTAGYVFGLAVLAGAASTWFIQTPVSARASAIVRPLAETHAFADKTVLLERMVEPGQEVQPETPLARFVVASNEVVNLELSAELRAQVRQAEERGDEATAERCRAMLVSVPQEVTPREQRSGAAGWVTDVAEVGVGETLPAGVPAMRIAMDDGVYIETTVSPDRVPTVGRGDVVKVLLPPWDTTPFLARIEEITLWGTFCVPAAEFDDMELTALAKAPDENRVTIAGLSYPVQTDVAEDEVSLRVDLTAADAPPEAKTGQRVRASLDATGTRVLSSRWAGFETHLVLSAEKDALPEGIRRTLLAHLTQGEYEVPVGDAWVETGHCRLFARLFSK